MFAQSGMCQANPLPSSPVSVKAILEGMQDAAKRSKLPPGQRLDLGASSSRVRSASRTASELEAEELDLETPTSVSPEAKRQSMT